MSKEYDLYISEHRANVKKGLEWMQQNLPPAVIDHDKMVEAVLNAEIHDESKYSKEEYDAYDDYFYGGERTFEVIQAFNLAWLHHQHENPHHWQYWVLVEDGDETDGKAITLNPQEMPLEYVYEMIADWWTFSWRANNLLEIFNWYNEHRPKMVLHSKTRYFVEQILNEMYKILKMQVTLRNPEIDIVQFEIPENMTVGVLEDDGFGHSGIKGQKWGVRRYQNPDGTLTEEGKKRYRKSTVFVSGSSKTQSEDSPYYRKSLPKQVRDELDNYIKNEDTILVGDAPGVDRQVQDYLNNAKYNNVEVYGPGKQVRYSANKSWKTHAIDAPEFEEGSKEWLAKKDKAMSSRADKGLAVILDEGAKATRKNIERMLDDDKSVQVFMLDQNGDDLDRWLAQRELRDVIVHDGIKED